MSFFPYHTHLSFPTPFFYNPSSAIDDILEGELDLSREFRTLEQQLQTPPTSTETQYSNYNKSIRSETDVNGNVKTVERRSYVNPKGDRITTDRYRVNDKTYELTKRQLKNQQEEVFENLRDEEKTKFLENWRNLGGEQFASIEGVGGSDQKRIEGGGVSGGEATTTSSGGGGESKQQSSQQPSKSTTQSSSQQKTPPQQVEGGGGGVSEQKV